VRHHFKLVILILAGIGIAVIFWLFFKLNSQKFQEVCFKDYCFEVEIADTPQERARGLMYKTSLKENEGMLFVFDKPGIYGFWMKNTLIPLDIIWLDKSKEVVFIKENAQPCLKENCSVFKNQKPAKYILEINAGKVKELNLKVGDKLRIL